MLWWCGLALVFCGCRFDSSGLETGRPDARPDAALDATSDLAGADLDAAPLPDLPPPDQATPDQATPDTRKPDTRKPDTLKPDTQPSCLAKYGGAGIPAFKPCSESPTECGFYFASVSTATCNDICAKGGGTCIKELDDTNNDCAYSSESGCEVAHGDGVCICSR